MTAMCHCGKPLHYADPNIERLVTTLVASQGPYVDVTLNGRIWRVQRHYVALHGVHAAEIPNLGFEEITSGDDVPLAMRGFHD